MFIYTKKLSTPAGSMIAGVDDEGIYLFDFEHRKMLPRILQRVLAHSNKEFKEQAHPNHSLLEAQLEEYFQGTRKEFDLPIKLMGSPFQVKVWEALLAIPYGETRTYKQQSIVFGDEKAIRAVASANGANCMAIIVPCHRVIGTDHSLTGYAGGIATKKWLLTHEQKNGSSFYQKELF